MAILFLCKLLVYHLTLYKRNFPHYNQFGLSEMCQKLFVNSTKHIATLEYIRRIVLRIEKVSEDSGVS